MYKRQVLLRLPRKFREPEEHQDTALPCRSVMVTTVLLTPAFTDFQYVIQVIVLVTASDTCCQPFEFLQPSVPCKPFLA